jgi:hypothetical protein
MSRLLRAVALFLPVAVVAVVWYPFVEHYYVPRTRIPDSLLAGFVDAPSDATMAVLGRQFLGTRVTGPTGLAADSPEERLRHFGFFQTAIDLDEFERTGDTERFAAIERFVVEFSEYANGRFAYDEFLWNDHAIANRVFVLARFWGHYRRWPSFDLAHARAVLEHVAKNLRFLARDDHFTYWTNHGVMQSLALLHAANAFPAMPGRERFVGVALDRLEKQLRSFASESGWIMEHSAGYQEFGANLLTTLLVELDLLGEEVPPEWREKAAQSKRILERLARPGGSLPNFGDSDTALADAGAAPETCDALESIAQRWPEGYYVGWDVAPAGGAPRCAQTVMVWAGFVSNAHRRPNELSVHYWVDGVDYNLAAGYWPYGDLDRLEAIGWRGSNAPHFLGEGDASGHAVSERGACFAEPVRFIDLERRDPAGRSVRRQLVDLGVNGLLIIDSAHGDDARPLESVWRIDSRLEFIGPDGGVLQNGVSSGVLAHVMQVAGATADVGALADAYSRDGHPSPAKFGFVSGREFVPAYVVTSTQPTLIVMQPVAAGGRHELFALTEFLSPARWRVESGSGTVAVERRGSTLALERSAAELARCSIDAPPEDGAGVRAMEASFAAMAQEYPSFNAWTFYRLKATVGVAAVFAAQLVVVALAARLSNPRLLLGIDAVAIAGWLAVGGYLTLVYLAQ